MFMKQLLQEKVMFMSGDAARTGNLGKKQKQKYYKMNSIVSNIKSRLQNPRDKNDINYRQESSYRRILS